MAVLILVLVVCFVLILGAVLGFVLPQRRARELERRANQMGFTFQPTAKLFEGTDVRGLTIIEDGKETIVRNLLTRTTLAVNVFDLPLATEYMVAVTTAAAFRSASKLPVFQIGSRNVLEKVEEVFGKKCLHLDDREFSRNFYVHCSNQAEAQSFFTADKLSQLRQTADRFHIESSTDWVLVYQQGRKVSIEQIPEFVEKASLVALALIPTQLPSAA